MKAKLFIAAGVAIIAGAIYYFKFRRRAPEAVLPKKENERHHLTNVFSKAKEVAVGN